MQAACTSTSQNLWSLDLLIACKRLGTAHGQFKRLCSLVLSPKGVIETSC